MTNTVEEHGMSLLVAEHADRVAYARRALVSINVECTVPGRMSGLDLEIAQRLVDNATVLLEQAKIYQRRLKAHKRQADHDMARLTREAFRKTA